MSTTTTPAATPAHVLRAAVDRGLHPNTAARLARKYRFLRTSRPEFLQEVEAAIAHDTRPTDVTSHEAQSQSVTKVAPAAAQAIELIVEPEPAQPAAALSPASEPTPSQTEPVAQAGPCERLHRAGFEAIPIIPPSAPLSQKSAIKANQCGKIPGLKGLRGWHGFDWRRHQTTLADAEQWDRDGAGVGIKCGRVIGIDIDVLDHELAPELRTLAIRILGDAPSRTGRAPKVLLPYRLDGQLLSKRAIAWIGKAGKPEKVEFLASGQQFVALGIHPGTLKRYTWDRELTTPEDLPTIRSEQLDQFLDEVNTLLAQRGIQATRSGQGRLAGADVVLPQEELLAPKIDDLGEVVAHICNTEDTDRDTWISTGIAIKAAAGRDHEPEGLELFLDYSHRWEGGVNDPDYVRTTWDSFHAPFSIGWGYLLDRAQAQGFNTAVYEFQPLPIATPPARQDSSSSEGCFEPLPTEGERIAALLHDAGAALLLEADELPDGELPARWHLLRAAAESTDPAEEVFFRSVVPEAKALRGYKKPQQFARLLGAGLSSGTCSTEWLALDAPTRALLVRAAFVLVIGPAIHLPPPRLVRPDGDPLPDLVGDLFPELGVGVIVGPPNTGKSFLAADLAARVASGATHFGSNLVIVRQGPVLYFASEDAEGLQARLKAWSTNHLLPVNKVSVFDSTPDLTDFGKALEHVQSAVSEAPASPDHPVLVIIDTVRDALGGADENDAGVMAYAVKVARTIGRMVGATVLLIGHSPHSDPTRLRGSTAFPAAVDVILSVKQQGNTIRATVEKRRRGPRGVQYAWHLRLDGGEAVLYPGPDQGDDVVIAGTAQVDQDARLVFDVLGDIASLEHAATSKQLNDALQASCEGMRDSNDAKARTRASVRRSRAIQRAIDLKWITVQGPRGRKEYAPGPDQPATEPLAPADLVGVEG